MITVNYCVNDTMAVFSWLVLALQFMDWWCLGN